LNSSEIQDIMVIEDSPTKEVLKVKQENLSKDYSPSFGSKLQQNKYPYQMGKKIQ